MNKGGMWDRVSGMWKQMKGEAKKQWGKLTDDDLMEVEGNRDKLAGKLQERYGMAKDDANRQIDEWAERLKM
ncbi:MAG TPA: CsbD family protein [Aggregatilineaceae bacterium]|nr:CsbD family protein [Aggregatilineaceae bacterium]